MRKEEDNFNSHCIIEIAALDIRDRCYDNRRSGDIPRFQDTKNFPSVLFAIARYFIVFNLNVYDSEDENSLFIYLSLLMHRFFNEFHLFVTETIKTYVTFRRKRFIVKL